MEISYQISWRRSANGHECTSDNVTNSTLINGEDNIRCQYSCSGTIISPISYVCTDFSVEDDWSFGEYHSTSIFNSASDENTVTIGTVNVNWIKEAGDGNWNVSTTFSLAKRTDTGKINSSPRILPTPPLYLQQGCSYTISLPVSDPDNDIVRCRWAVGTECASICNRFYGAVLDSATCTITYTANNGTGIKVVAIMIEDYAPGSPYRPLSSVALQFLILVLNSQPCSTLKRSPKIVLHPLDVVVRLTDLNHNSTLTCKANRESSYYWEKQNGKVSIYSTGVRTNTLTLINLQPESAGRYRCVAFACSICKRSFSNYATVTVNSKLLFSFIFINYICNMYTSSSTSDSITPIFTIYQSDSKCYIHMYCYWL